MMKRLNIIILIASFTLISSFSFGGNDGDSLKVKNRNPLRIGVNAGMGMGNIRYPQANVHFFNNYLETTGSYALSPRTGLIMGLGYNRINFRSPSFNGEGMGQTISSDQYFISAGGYHHVNDRLTLTGMAQFSLPVNGTSGGMMANPFMNSRNFDFNAQYKISEKFSIGAGFRYSEGQFGNGFGNSFMNPMMPFGSPYGAPFGNPRW